MAKLPDRFQISSLGFSHLVKWTPAPVRPRWRLYWNPTPGAVIRFEETTYRLDKSHYLLMPPNTAFHQNLEKPCDTLFMHFTLGMPFDRLRDRSYYVPLSADERRDLNALHQIARKRQHNIPGQFRLLSFLSRALSHIPDEDWPRAPGDSRIAQAIAELERNPGDTWNTPRLANLASLSVNAFTRAFKKELGIAPQTYVRDLRLNLAASRLQETDEPIDRIAQDCGFSERNYFTRCFMKKFGRAPAQWRRMLRSLPV